MENTEFYKISTAKNCFIDHLKVDVKSQVTIESVKTGNGSEKYLLEFNETFFKTLLGFTKLECALEK